MECARCCEAKIITDFYANDRTCKTCRCELVRANRLAKADYYHQYDRDRSSQPKRQENNRRVTAEWR